jgi:hypothetical protein
VNYIELINNFWALNKEYSFTPNEKAVYFALLNKCNELGWKNPYNQSNGYLALDSGMSESAMVKARNTLKQKGLIAYQAGDGRRCNTVYKLIILKKGNNKGTFKKDLSGTLLGDLSGTLSDTLLGENGNDNNKLKTKVKKTKVNSSGSSEPPQEKKMFWKEFVEVWNSVYESLLKAKYTYATKGKDFNALEKIYEVLKKRSEERKREWTKEYSEQSFMFFLNQAWNKDEWLRQNFNPSNVLNQINQILNSNGSNKTTNNNQRTNGKLLEQRYGSNTNPAEYAAGF